LHLNDSQKLKGKKLKEDVNPPSEKKERKKGGKKDWVRVPVEVPMTGAFLQSYETEEESQRKK